MVKKSEIQVFISCPGDIKNEKQIIENVCKSLTESAENFGNISFRVKQWNSILGHFGERTQKVINEKIGNYDIYIGIWWMRFGSKSGAFNLSTNEEFQSNTEEEFYLAYENWKSNKTPEMFLFFRRPKANPKTGEKEQLQKVLKFKAEQDKNGLLHSYSSNIDFQEKIQKVLLDKMFNVFLIENKEQKTTYLDSRQPNDLQQYLIKTELPEGYLHRLLIHYSFVNDNSQILYQDKNRESLTLLINIQKRIVILGDAGSGKSTELKNLANHLGQNDSAYFPIFQSLNLYTPEKTIESFLPDFWKEISPNLLVIIWDGLDEIQPQHFITVIRQISLFAEGNSEIRIVISCRTNFYELPSMGSSGTLLGFEPYFIKDFGLWDVKQYYASKFRTEEAEQFIKVALEERFEDLLTKPFFLMLLAEIYAEQKNLHQSRTSLFKQYILSRFNFDKTHFKGTFNIREKKEEILNLLEKVGLGMEIFAKNLIDESELLKIISSEELIVLKFSTAFKKKDGEEGKWQFEHNNFQEYLAAKALSQLPFESVVKFIAFEPSYKKLIPSWVNTLTFLFSMLEKNEQLLKELTNWVIESDKEIIVKIEREKISEEIRNEIFKSIYNYYKSYDIWLRSNKFNEKDLARFGQSIDSIKFLIEELTDVKNTKTVKRNCIHLLGNFEYENNVVKNEVRNVLLKQIDKNINDVHFLNSTIYALNYAKINDGALIDELMVKLGKRSSQHIRSAMYLLLLSSNSLDKYVKYFIEGYELKDTESEERGSISSFDESWYLKQCIESIKEPKSLIEIIDFISDGIRHKYENNFKDLIKTIVENATEAFERDNSIYKSVLKWLQNEIGHYRHNNSELIFTFFDKTETREQAFFDVWKSEDDTERIRIMTLSKLLNPKLITFVLGRYSAQEISNKDLQGIYFDMQWVRNPFYELFEKRVGEETTFKIEKPLQIDHDAIRKKKAQEDFDILFNPKEFKSEVLKVLEDLNKEEILFDELSQVRINNRTIDLEEYYYGPVLRLLSALYKKNRVVKKKEIVSWFKNKKNVEWFCISLIHESLPGNSEINISENQKKFIETWSFENIDGVHFKNAIIVKENGTSFNPKAIFIWNFWRKFNFNFPKNVLLDMLSFYYFENNEPVETIDLIKKLPEADVKERIIANIREGISVDQVLKNHVSYAVNKGLVEIYPSILDEIVDLKRNEYSRRGILDIYFQGTKDITGLKTILLVANDKIKWSIIDKLINVVESDFLIQFLINLINSENPIEEKVRASEYLIQLQNIEGLEFYTKWIEAGNIPEDNRYSNISVIKNISSLSILMRLLEIGYQREPNGPSYERLSSVVLGALHNIALISEEYFTIVKDELVQFMKANVSKYKDVNYILYSIEQMENQFYMNKARSYSIKEVKEKLKLIEN